MCCNEDRAPVIEEGGDRGHGLSLGVVETGASAPVGVVFLLPSSPYRAPCSLLLPPESLPKSPFTLITEASEQA